MCSLLDCSVFKFGLHNLPIRFHILVGLHAQDNPGCAESRTCRGKLAELNEQKFRARNVKWQQIYSINLIECN
jgi:hypothetical protein